MNSQYYTLFSDHSVESVTRRIANTRSARIEYLDDRVLVIVEGSPRRVLRLTDGALTYRLDGKWYPTSETYVEKIHFESAIRTKDLEFLFLLHLIEPNTIKTEDGKSLTSQLLHFYQSSAACPAHIVDLKYSI